MIEQDLLRLYPEHDFFREPETVKLMQRVLFLWSKENTDTSYRQGMHELLAPFVLVFHRDAKATKLGLHEAYVQTQFTYLSSFNNKMGGF